MSSSDSSSINRARVKRPEPNQVEWQSVALNDMIPEDHRVRLVWAYVESLDLSALYQKIRAVEGHVGRDAVDPGILLALWMYATIEGVSSARHLERLCKQDLAYLWICGGVGVNSHMMSDFRTGHGEVLDRLLTDTIGTLIHQGLVTLETVAQDGVRVRANAGSSSFRRKKTLEKCRDEAREQVRNLREQSEKETGNDQSNKRREAARRRAVREREQRVERALEELGKLENIKEKKEKGSGEKARSSTTDAEARQMKMGDGGFRPAYNVQFASEGKARVIVSVEVSNSGSDQPQMPPMHESISQRYNKRPTNYLVDGGFATNASITQVEQAGSRVIAPIHDEKGMRKRGTDPHARQPIDSDEVAEFRQRMASKEAKALYKERSSIAEYPNAECRNRGMRQFRVRGREKVKAVTL